MLHFIMLASANFISPPVTPPTISILHPENKTYNLNTISLSFIGKVYSSLTEPTPAIGMGNRTAEVFYSLDGQANVTINGNTTLTGLSEGSHSITVYVNDTEGKRGASETVYFTLVTPNEPDGTEQHEMPSSQTRYEYVVVAVVAALLIGVTIVLSIAFYRKRFRLRKSHRVLGTFL